MGSTELTRQNSSHLPSVEEMAHLRCKRFELFFTERYHFELYSESVHRQQLMQAEVADWLDVVRGWCGLILVPQAVDIRCAQANVIQEQLEAECSRLTTALKDLGILWERHEEEQKTKSAPEEECVRLAKALRDLGALWEAREAELTAGWESAKANLVANEKAQAAVAEKHLQAQRRAIESIAAQDRRQLEAQVMELRHALHLLLLQQQSNDQPKHVSPMVEAAAPEADDKNETTI